MGSAPIGQQFTGPQYFHGRPSAQQSPLIRVRRGKHCGSLQRRPVRCQQPGATHKDLSEAVAQRVAQYRADNGLAADLAVPVDAVTASASAWTCISLWPPRCCNCRVARGREGSRQTRCSHCWRRKTEQRTLGLLGEPRVNVLQLNLALDALQPATSAVKE